MQEIRAGAGRWLPLRFDWRRLTDVALVLAILGAGYWWGTAFQRSWVRDGQTSQYYQRHFEPAVMLACGRGFVQSQAAVLTPALEEFLTEKVDSFSCDQIPADVVVTSKNLPHWAWYYLFAAVSLTWRLFGIAWSTLTPLFGLLFAVTLACTYGLLRQGMGRVLALAGTFMFAISSLHLTNLPHLRDYAKAPFVLGSILLMARLVQGQPTRRRVLLLAAGSGLVLGVGYGFRTDLLANIPVLLVTIAVFLPGGLIRNVRLKAQAVALALGLFVATSWPVITFTTGQGGCQWHVALLGLSSYFDDRLEIAPASYDWGGYSDEFIHTAVGSYFNPGVSSAEGPAFCGVEYDRLTGTYLFRIFTGFPGDTSTRAVASMSKTLDLSVSMRAAPLKSYDDGLYRWRTDALIWISGYGPLLSLAVVGMAAWGELRLGVWLLMMVLWFGSLPMVQLHDRHYFHLESMNWFMLGTFMSVMAAGVVRAIRYPFPRLRVAAHPKSGVVRGWPALLAIALCFVVVWQVVATAKRIQRPRVSDLLVAIRAATAERVVLVPQPIEGNLFPMTPQLPGSAEARSARFWVEYLRIDVDARACGPDGAVTVRYDPPYQDWTRSWKVGPDIATILTPVFRGFRDITEPAGRPGCIRGFFRSPTFDRLPVWISAAMPRDLSNLRAGQSYAGPRRYQELVAMARFGANSPLQFSKRLRDVTADMVWAPWKRPRILTFPDDRYVTRSELARVRSTVGVAGYVAAAVEARAGGWAVEKRAEGPYSYLIAARADDVAKGARLMVRGRLDQGGLSVGIIKDGRWLHSLNVTQPGPFVVVMEPAAAGPYDIIIANNQLEEATPTRALVETIAWIDPTSGPSPATPKTP